MAQLFPLGAEEIPQERNAAGQILNSGTIQELQAQNHFPGRPSFMHWTGPVANKFDAMAKLAGQNLAPGAEASKESPVGEIYTQEAFTNYFNTLFDRPENQNEHSVPRNELASSQKTSIELRTVSADEIAPEQGTDNITTELHNSLLTLVDNTISADGCIGSYQHASLIARALASVTKDTGEALAILNQVEESDFRNLHQLGDDKAQKFCAQLLRSAVGLDALKHLTGESPVPFARANENKLQRSLNEISSIFVPDNPLYVQSPSIRQLGMRGITPQIFDALNVFANSLNTHEVIQKSTQAFESVCDQLRFRGINDNIIETLHDAILDQAQNHKGTLGIPNSSFNSLSEPEQKQFRNISDQLNKAVNPVDINSEHPVQRLLAWTLALHATQIASPADDPDWLRDPIVTQDRVMQALFSARETSKNSKLSKADLKYAESAQSAAESLLDVLNRQDADAKSKGDLFTWMHGLTTVADRDFVLDRFLKLNTLVDRAATAPVSFRHGTPRANLVKMGKNLSKSAGVNKDPLQGLRTIGPLGAQRQLAAAHRDNYRGLLDVAVRKAAETSDKYLAKTAHGKNSWPLMEARAIAGIFKALKEGSIAYANYNIPNQPQDFPMAKAYLTWFQTGQFDQTLKQKAARHAAGISKESAETAENQELQAVYEELLDNEGGKLHLPCLLPEGKLKEKTLLALWDKLASKLPGDVNTNATTDALQNLRRFRSDRYMVHDREGIIQRLKDLCYMRMRNDITLQDGGTFSIIPNGLIGLAMTGSSPLVSVTPSLQLFDRTKTGYVNMKANGAGLDIAIGTTTAHTLGIGASFNLLAAEYSNIKMTLGSNLGAGIKGVRSHSKAAFVHFNNPPNNDNSGLRKGNNLNKEKVMHGLGANATNNNMMGPTQVAAGKMDDFLDFLLNSSENPQQDQEVHSTHSTELSSFTEPPQNDAWISTTNSTLTPKEKLAQEMANKYFSDENMAIGKRTETNYSGNINSQASFGPNLSGDTFSLGTSLFAQGSRTIGKSTQHGSDGAFQDDKNVKKTKTEFSVGLRAGYTNTQKPNEPIAESDWSVGQSNIAPVGFNLGWLLLNNEKTIQTRFVTQRGRISSHNSTLTSTTMTFADWKKAWQANRAAFEATLNPAFVQEVESLIVGTGGRDKTLDNSTVLGMRIMLKASKAKELDYLFAQLDEAKQRMRTHAPNSSTERLQLRQSPKNMDDKLSRYLKAREDKREIKAQIAAITNNLSSYDAFGMFAQGASGVSEIFTIPKTNISQITSVTSTTEKTQHGKRDDDINRTQNIMDRLEKLPPDQEPIQPGQNPRLKKKWDPVKAPHLVRHQGQQNLVGTAEDTSTAWHTNPTQHPSSSKPQDNPIPARQNLQTPKEAYARYPNMVEEDANRLGNSILTKLQSRLGEADINHYQDLNRFDRLCTQDELNLEYGNRPGFYPTVQLNIPEGSEEFAIGANSAGTLQTIQNALNSHGLCALTVNTGGHWVALVITRENGVHLFDSLNTEESPQRIPRIQNALNRILNTPGNPIQLQNTTIIPHLTGIQNENSANACGYMCQDLINQLGQNENARIDVARSIDNYAQSWRNLTPDAQKNRAAVLRLATLTDWDGSLH